MLVLRRVSGESIVIGKNAEIVVKILSCENGTISIGIDAPQVIQVDRLEIFEKRLNDLEVSDKHKSLLRRRLKVFQQNIKYANNTNEMLFL